MFYGRALDEGPVVLFQPHYTFKGVPNAEGLFEVDTMLHSDCGFAAQEGESYLVHAGLGEDGVLRASSCGTFHGEEARDRLRELGVHDSPVDRAADFIGDKRGIIAVLAVSTGLALALRGWRLLVGGSFRDTG